MKIRTFLIGIALLLCANLSFAQSVGKIIKGKEFEGIILENVKTYYSEVDSSKKWLPTLADIELMEKLLPNYLTKQSVKENQMHYSYAEVLKNLSNYRRQYIGYITPTGEKIIFVSAFLCGEGFISDFKNWDKEYISFRDGGTAAWRIYFQTKSKKFSNFNINSLG